MKKPVFDVCVIGTGAGGGVMIDQLTAAGFSVVALERGPYRVMICSENLKKRAT